MKYIIYSLKYSDKQACFWRSDNAGYTSNPFEAGQYTEAEVEADPSYYNNGESTIAIPVSYDILTSLGLIPKNVDKKVLSFWEFEQKRKLSNTEQ